MNINWYPGHMKKTLERLNNDLKLVDIVIELIDARIPLSSKNPEIEKIIEDKNNILVLNKKDLADELITSDWIKYYENKYSKVIAINSLNNRDINYLVKTIKEVDSNRINKKREKGVIGGTTRAMIVGIPNVGKSTLINSLSNRRGAKVGDTPGVTKTNQWIKTKHDIELLDTPGVLWPKFEDPKIGKNIAFIGSIRDDILDTETLALRLIEKLLEIKPRSIENRYKINIEDKTPLEIMEEIARNRGAILRGNEIDYTRVANIILDEYRSGLLTRITLERIEDA